MAKDKRCAELVERFSSQLEEIEETAGELQGLQESYFTLIKDGTTAGSASSQDC